MRGVLAAALLAAPASAFAAFGASDVGTTTAQFLQLGVGARAVGMGQAFSAVADDASAMYWNPAGLTQTEARAVTFMHSAYIDSSFFDYGAYAQNLGARGAFGASVQYYSAGSIPGTDVNGVGTGNFTPNDVALAGGYAYRLQGLASWLDGYSLGLAAKYIRSTIATTAETGAADLGILSPGYLDGKLHWALTASNIGGDLKFDQEGDPIPLIIKAGGSYHISDLWLVAADLAAPRSNSPYGAFGTEYRMPFAGGMSLAGRLGYNTQTTTSIGGFTGASFGVGLGARQFDADFAFVPFGQLGQTFRMSLSMRFGKAPEPVASAAPVAAPVPAKPVAVPAAEQPPAVASAAPQSPLAEADRFFDDADFDEARQAYLAAIPGLDKDDPLRARASDRLGRIALQGGDCRKASLYFRAVIHFELRLKLKDDAGTDAVAGLKQCDRQ